MAEFTDAVVLSNRSLKSNEMFAIAIDKIIEHWSGSIEAGKCHLFKLGITFFGLFCNFSLKK